MKKITVFNFAMAVCFVLVSASSLAGVKVNSAQVLAANPATLEINASPTTSSYPYIQIEIWRNGKLIKTFDPKNNGGTFSEPLIAGGEYTFRTRYAKYVKGACTRIAIPAHPGYYDKCDPNYYLYGPWLKDVQQFNVSIAEGDYVPPAATDLPAPPSGTATGTTLSAAAQNCLASGKVGNVYYGSEVAGRSCTPCSIQSIGSNTYACSIP